MDHINLVVLRCRDIEASREFYECFDMKFKKHAHRDGPMHYVHDDKNADVVFELYPAKPDEPADRTVLGFGVNLVEETYELLKKKKYNPTPVMAKDLKRQDYVKSFVARDPDNRRIEVKWRGIPF